MIIEITESIAENLTQTEKSIVKYINQNETKLSRMSIVDIAFETFSSPSTVSRAIRKCGINGFNELRYKLMRPNTDRAIVSINEIMNKSLIEGRCCLSASPSRICSRLSGASSWQRILVYTFWREG